MVNSKGSWYSDLASEEIKSISILFEAIGNHSAFC